MNLDQLRDLLEKARTSRRFFEPVWALNQAFLEGEQWVFHDGARLARPILDEDRVTLTENWILPAVRKEVAKISKQRPSFRCRPRTAGDEDVAAAETAEKIAEYMWGHLALPTHYARALLWSRSLGAGFLKAVWDPTAGAGVDVLVGPDGKPIPGDDGRPLRADELRFDTDQLAERMGLEPGALRVERVAQGDVRVVVRSAWQIFPDPLAETLEDAEWLFEESIASQEFVFDRYGREIEPDTSANPGLVQSHLARVARGTSEYKGVKLYEFWRRPCGRYPDGLHVTFTAREVLEVDKRPFDPMPYVMFRGIDLPGRFWPTSIVEQLRDVQVERNKTISQIAENRNRIAHPHPVVDRTAVGDLDEFERAMGTIGAILFVDPTSENPYPQYLEPPQLPQYVDRYLDRNTEAYQHISAQHEVSNAQVPAGVTAAAAINTLVEQDDTQLGPVITDLEVQLGRLGSKILRLVAEYYTDTRTIQIVDENYGWQIMDFRGALLRGHTEVEVEAGSTMPKTLAAKQALMQDVLHTFLQNGIPLNQRQLAKYFRDMQVGGFEHFIDEASIDELQVRSENRRMAHGEPVEINDFDDDEAHIEGHEAAMKQPAYQRLPPERKMLFEQHLAAHRERLANAQYAEMAMQMAPQLAEAGQRLELNAAQADQRMQQTNMLHAQRLLQGEELHQQRLAQMQALAQQRQGF